MTKIPSSLFIFLLILNSCKPVQYAKFMPTTKENFVHNSHKKNVEELPPKAETAQNANLVQSQSWEIPPPKLEASSTTGIPVFTNPILKLQAQNLPFENTKTENKKLEEKPDTRKTNTLALVSGLAGLGAVVLLFSGLLFFSTGAGLFGLLSILSLLGIFGGIASLSQAKKRNEKGKGWGIAGIVFGSIFVGFVVLVVVALSSFH